MSIFIPGAKETILGYVVPFNLNVYCIDPLIYVDATVTVRKKSISGSVVFNTHLPINFKHLVHRITADVNTVYRKRHVTNVTVYSRILDMLSFDYAEKLVPGLGEAFPLYHMGFRPYMPWYGQVNRVQVAGGVRYSLIHKCFSGDVSGSIGESLFVYIATIIYGVSNIIHLRPEKTSMLTPDFVVYDVSDVLKLRPLLCLDSLNVSRTSKLFIECKASAGDKVDPKRIAKGLAQLFTVMDYGDLGILFLLQRDTSSQLFHVISVPLIRRR